MLKKLRSLFAKISSFFKHEGTTVNQQNSPTTVTTGDITVNITIAKG